jgi:hypothetical protein
MRTAEICPTCATYTNAVCVIYDGLYLTNTDVTPLDSLDVVITKINDNLVPVSGVVAPTLNAVYIGQLYVDTATPALYYAKSVGSSAADWVLLANA